ncbi:MAG: GNAT family N-acetyltransferase [Gammaproteobacteria bacterium]|nr:GNAT family N-acetyltransferase [Gammaproteobacteria bacterium]
MREPLRSTDPEYQSVADGSSAIGPHELLDTIESLKKFRLIEHEEFDVYCAPFESLGPIMEQIAIARELTFRSVGEGTGLSKDSDEFDPHYLHLFLWDKTALRIAGAYRVGLVDEIVAAHGVKGLYSRSLYKYDEAFVNQLGSAIEMGRSFIHPDYQKKPVSLNLLWRGIGRILVEKPRYHTLFGSVSISREYSDLARALIADTMLTNFKASEYDQLVRPITPHKIMNRVWTSEMIAELSNVKMLGKLIGRCDPGKAVPVLLRHYLSVNGKLVCFNIHPNFNDSLEGLIIVDARKTDAKTLSRFLGTDGYEHFMSFHKLQDTA